MRNTDIETLGRIALALKEYFPIKEYGLYTEYMGVYESLKAQNDLEKQRYQEKAEYHREVTRKWRQDNKERNSAYQKEYYAKKRAAKQHSE